jgi:hypothetical protein
MVDPRTIIGALVSAKACHVTSEAECHRCYGARMKEKRVVGIVVASSTRVPEGGRRASTFITARYTFGGGVVRQKVLNARSVKLWDGTGDNDGIPEPPPHPAPDRVLAVRDSNIPAAAGVVGRSSDNAGGENDSTGGETVEPDQDARDVYVGLDANDPFDPIGLAGNAPLPLAHDNNTPVVTTHGIDWYRDDVAARNDIIAPVAEAGKSSLQQDPEGEATLLFSGTAPAAEALAKFSDPVQTSKSVQEKRDGEAGKPRKQQDEDEDQLVWHFQRDDELSTQQDREDKDPSLFPGAANAAEALAKFSDTPQPNSPGKTWYDSDDSDIKEMVNFANQWGAQDQSEGSVQKEDRRLESIWKSNPHSADRQREPIEKGDYDAGETLGNGGRDNEVVEQDSLTDQETVVAPKRVASTLERQESSRDKRQREMSQLAWAKEIRKAAGENSAAIIQKVPAPKEGIESPDRKKRAAPSPSRPSNADDDEASMTSSTAGELANAVFNQIQEAPSEAIAPAGPRKDV